MLVHGTFAFIQCQSTQSDAGGIRARSQTATSLEWEKIPIQMASVSKQSTCMLLQRVCGVLQCGKISSKELALEALLTLLQYVTEFSCNRALGKNI